MATFDGIIKTGEVVRGNADTFVIDGIIIAGGGAGAGGSDLDAPVYSAISPADSSTILPADVFNFTVEDVDSGIAAIYIWVTYAGEKELIYSDGGFEGNYTGVATNIANGVAFTNVRRLGGWLENAITLEIRAIDNRGNLGTQSISYNVSPDPAVITVAETPAASSVIAAGDSIQFDITDQNDQVRKILISVGYENEEELMYDLDAGFIAPYTGTDGIIANGRTVTVSRTGGWREDVLSFRVVALDEQANEITSNFGYTVNPDPTPVVDVTPPALANVSPVDASVLAPTDTINFDVVEAGGLSKVVVWVLYENFAEVIYDGSAFVGDYSGSTATVAGLEFTNVGRAGGWKEDVIAIQVAATDTSGNNADLTINYTVSPDPTVIPDVVAPTVGNYNPVNAAIIAPGDSIEVDITDSNSGLNRAIIRAQYADREEMIYDGTGFVAPYTGSTAAIADGLRFSLQRIGDWAASPLNIDVTAIDNEGNVSDSTSGYTIVPDPTPAPDDVTPPAVSNYDPSPGTPITASTAIEFDVTDNNGNFRRVIIAVFFPTTGITEIAFDGDNFIGFYASASSRALITGGHRYTLLRTGGWVAAPTIRTFAIDTSGNEA